MENINESEYSCDIILTKHWSILYFLFFNYEGYGIIEIKLDLRAYLLNLFPFKKRRKEKRTYCFNFVLNQSLNDVSNESV